MHRYLNLHSNTSFAALVKIIFFGCFLSFIACTTQAQKEIDAEGYTLGIQTGAERFNAYLPLIKDKTIAIVANQTSRVGDAHLVDTLLALGVDVRRVFAPEHGFRGLADAGESVVTTRDKKTGLPIISLYGKNKKPRAIDLADVEYVLFDIQDVGVRFYTYISTMHYVMQTCAELGKTLILLDRPNPNGHYVDGPVLDTALHSFVGMHPVALVHGMTIGEYAQMINAEGWLGPNLKCNLKIITCQGYDHRDFYKVTEKPSPNLPNMLSIYLYPSLGLFEGTVVSVGRGTEEPFQKYGHPAMLKGNSTFIPRSVTGAKYPPYKDELCQGIDLTKLDLRTLRDKRGIHIDYVIEAYKNSPDQGEFFLKNGFFNLLAGNKTLMQQIKAGKTSEEIEQSWEAELAAFKAIRAKYLLYRDF